MKKALIRMLSAAAILLVLTIPRVCQAADADAGRVDVSFEYRRQSGSGSNQFAVWVENAEGAVVKTLFVTNFTAGRGGWKFRAQSLSQWVASSNIAAMSSGEVDAITRATPASGTVTASWDCRDRNGALVPSGEYAIILEATLRGENRVVYRTIVDIGGASKSIEPEPHYFGSGTAERGMIQNVRVDCIR